MTDQPPHRQAGDGLQSPREYLKFKYSAPPECCKCGDCQLVPPAVLAAWAELFDKLPSRDSAEGAGEADLRVALLLAAMPRLAQLQETVRQCRGAWLEAVNPQGDYEQARDPAVTGLADVLDAFSILASPALLPSPDALGQDAERAHDKLYGFPSVLSPDGAGETEPGSLRELRQLIDEYDPLNSDWGFRKGVMFECLNRLTSGAGAAEPVARELDCILNSLMLAVHDNQGNVPFVKTRLRFAFKEVLRPLSASPPVRGDRDKFYAALSSRLASDMIDIVWQAVQESGVCVGVQPGAGERS